MTDEHTDFTKTTVRTFGPRGSPVFEQEEKTTDLDDLTERVEQTAVPFCTCGAPISGSGDVYRCCDCELICCTRCEIRLSRQHVCPLCARRRFDMDKRTFLTLVFLQHETMTFADLFDVTTQAGEITAVDIDAVANTVVKQGYLADDGTLSDRGREALHVGHQLYGADTDVQSVLDQLRVKAVAEQKR
ncbi:hypothetical protein NGM10_02030 [Halorussus salilacus]|uniref:hypothetical protein n=1 Tax=Halorussus salilacus TaxID=2953750 RepID=UPI00209E78A0|nr:hypothetical protein [Halorussus salilacus]USZ68530.1 hypothetical protein NGM10_02030 [Halorussus salilacus]